MPQPPLHTERLLLVPLADQHIELEVVLDSDPEVMGYLTGEASTRDEVLAAHARRMELGRKVDGLGFWMAFWTSAAGAGGGEFVGLMMLPPAHGPDQPDDPAVSDLGYRFLRRHWRKGLAGEASRALLRHAFDTVGQSRVIAQTMAVNTASRALMTSVGMRHVRTYFPQWDNPLPGSEQGEVEYEITRAMWEAS